METHIAITIRVCDRCNTGARAYLTGVPDGVVATRSIDLCRDCTDEVFPDLFRSEPRRLVVHHPHRGGLT